MSAKKYPVPLSGESFPSYLRRAQDTLGDAIDLEATAMHYMVANGNPQERAVASSFLDGSAKSTAHYLALGRAMCDRKFQRTLRHLQKASA